ncbi:hypothetical protein OVY29_05280 [Sphingopyxis sp. SE2]|uniref:hypothetical protein n=1 Tax=Sphingopyxis sp. SE2 TaxID=1586240 RepID=UPI0028C0DF06|nr:hypothetical protein [Sphingopyxis sp. SE2]MDT7528071.1 hypothetical protein [Sphingopyxis sp. SE2]
MISNGGLRRRAFALEIRPLPRGQHLKVACGRRHSDGARLRGFRPVVSAFAPCFVAFLDRGRRDDMPVLRNVEQAHAAHCRDDDAHRIVLTRMSCLIGDEHQPVPVAGEAGNDVPAADITDVGDNFDRRGCVAIFRPTIFTTAGADGEG